MVLRQILADCSASISELKKKPTALLNEADGASIAILNHNKPAVYLTPAETYEHMMEMLADYELSKLVESSTISFDPIEPHLLVT